MKSFQIIFGLILSLNLWSQNLPKEKHISSDGHFLFTGGNDYTGLYDMAKIQEVRLYFKEANYWTLLQNNYKSKKNLIANMKYNGKVLDSIGIRFKGQTSYSGGPGGGSAANSPKKSFDIELDFVRSKQAIDGYKTLNLNNSFQDPSFMREVFYYHNSRQHTPAAKANFVHLYINDEDWGIYQNVQQLNKDFLKEWWPSNDGSNWRADVESTPTQGGGGAQWGNGTTAFNFLGKDTTKYMTYYTLKSDGMGHPWQALATACEVLNSTPVVDLHNVLDQHFDMDKILWHLATEILFSDDDSYVFKGRMDYFLYRDAETGRFTTYDYDGNSVIENALINWSPFYNAEKVNYPLLNRVLANPVYRQRYIAHMKTLLSEYCDETSVSAKVDEFEKLIDAAVNADPKKQTKYEEFTTGTKEIKAFMKNRKSIILNNTEFKAESPVISDMSFSTIAKWEAPKSNEEALVEVRATHSAGITTVNLYYGTQLYGRFNSAITMTDDGLNGDKKANDNIFTGKIPAQAPQTWVRFYAEAVAKNNIKSVAYFPVGAEHDVMVYQVQADASIANDVVINEFMATNTNGPKDEKGSTSDWIELHNKSNAQIDLSGYFLSDNATNLKKWEVPAGVKINANGYLIFWADEDQKQGPTHMSFKLSSSGETISLADKNGALIDSHTYTSSNPDKSFARIPNGTGNFVETANYTFNAINNANATSEDLITISVSPNPANNFITINGINDVVKIYDLSGKLMYNNKVMNGEKIDVTTWQRGAYVVTGEKLKSMKIVIE